MPTELVFKEEGQEYAQVIRMVGNGEYEATCFDGTKQRLCHVRGNKNVCIEAGDILLVGLRDYQDEEADAILKYMPHGAKLLKDYGELPKNTRLLLNEEDIIADDGAGDDDYYIVLEDEDA